MQQPTQVDYIIIGQGLAGSSLAVQLLKRGRNILVIDKSDFNTSSRIAAGLFNPITGRNLVKTWLAEPMFTYLHQFYPAVEHKTGKKFFHPMPLYCPFTSVEEQNEWMAKSAEPAFENYVEKVFTSHTFGGLKDGAGGFLLKQCGYLDTTGYINAVKEWIMEEGFFRDEDFIEGHLKILSKGVEYNGCKASGIIFCQGEQTAGNKWFNWLPVNPLKGETITIEVAEKMDMIINRGVYIVPAEGGKTLRVGATYDFQKQTRSITSEAKEELSSKLNELITFPYRIVRQDWGIRPATRDRRPLLGAHPEYSSLMIFNGLGTKGVSLAPYFSEILIRWIEKEGALNKEVDINRYKSLILNSPK